MIPLENKMSIDKIGHDKGNGDFQQFLPVIINSYGSGDHPFADRENLHGFSVDYAINCTKQAIQVKDPERKQIAVSILEQLEKLQN